MNATTRRPQKPSRLVWLILDLSTHDAEVRGRGCRRTVPLDHARGRRPRGRRSTPGDMVQIVVPGGEQRRPRERGSYTPLAFGSDVGTTQILGVRSQEWPRLRMVLLRARGRPLSLGGTKVRAFVGQVDSTEFRLAAHSFMLDSTGNWLTR